VWRGSWRSRVRCSGRALRGAARHRLLPRLPGWLLHASAPQLGRPCAAACMLAHCVRRSGRAGGCGCVRGCPQAPVTPSTLGSWTWRGVLVLGVCLVASAGTALGARAAPPRQCEATVARHT
jgi:hypothetical protein